MKRQPTAPTIAEFYHRQTNYSPENVSSFVPDIDARPAAFRERLSDRSIDLREAVGGSLADPPAAGEAAIARIARLLYHTAGITAIHETSDGPFYLRASPSAGGLYPTEVYLATRDLEDVPNAIHGYSPLDDRLVPLWDGDFGMDIEELCFRHAGSIRARAFLILTGVFQRSAWRYRERAYRRILLDTGHLLGNAVAYAPNVGFHVVTIAGFYDSALNDLLFLDSKHEVVLVVAPVIDLEDIRDTRINSPFPFPSLKSTHDASNVTADGVMRLLHRRSEIVPDDGLLTRVPSKPLTLARTRPRDDSETVFLVPEREPRLPQLHRSDLGQVIRHRRSTRVFNREPIPAEALERVLRYGYEPTERYWKASSGLALSNCVFADPTLLTTWVVVLRVEGVRPGVYVYDPENRSLHLQRAGSFERALHAACLGQDLGRDCGAAVIHTTNLPLAVRRYGDRAYRYAHLDAGHIGGRMNLAAVGTGIGASGIGGFFDADVNELLGLPAAEGGGRVGHIGVYITVLGTPA